MKTSLRLSEAWFRRGLWLLSLVFASFLIGLGGTLVGDLPRVERALGLEDFIDRPAAGALRGARDQAMKAESQAEEALDQAQLRERTAEANIRSAEGSFNDWLATRSVTTRPEQDPALIERTHTLDALRAAQRQAQGEVERQQQLALDARLTAARSRRQLDELEAVAAERLQAAERGQELRVFGYRLALTLPLLAVAGWLFVRHRKGNAWPFVWGFVFFALFTFFVELVPYLPSYGGYVRYGVGIVLTLLIGRWAMAALQRYLARQQAAEASPESARRQALDYDTALARLAKGVCPGCERTVDLKSAAIDFCPHCGIGLFDHCGTCRTRKSAFSRFCHGCGAAAALQPRVLSPQVTESSNISLQMPAQDHKDGPR
ncbi:zinc ribbon domain-containing protein [Pseudacidovorax sp. RU35E]|uniref:zinc ribbon domain-containing protein n=1 Tax=Pseudacidovorax sp. RU35E TaxID=1907403 RepID=UPI000956F523|nr:zinc ribbon domain-containing protein [Pseudacidovorax sp. RU35E]SIQ77785.1 hypothetical protein SAMN05880557_105368 [Pseudacidovorax sp. RU35E]